jgi:rhodanese-related sulfurtransferase
MTLIGITPVEARIRMESGALMVDIRDRSEYARTHIPGARNIPLARLDDLDSQGAHEVIFQCKSGYRTRANADRLAQAAKGQAYLLTGGLDAWQSAALPVVIDRRQPIENMRQVQIVAGLLILMGVLLGFLVTPGFFALSGFIGAGLTFAGITGWCGMARFLALMPWNQPAKAL